MGQEFGQWREWRDEHSLDWHLPRRRAAPRRCCELNRELNRLYCRSCRRCARAIRRSRRVRVDRSAQRATRAYSHSCVAIRRDAASRPVVCVFNATPVPRDDLLDPACRGAAHTDAARHRRDVKIRRLVGIRARNDRIEASAHASSRLPAPLGAHAAAAGGRLVACPRAEQPRQVQVGRAGHRRA